MSNFRLFNLLITGNDWAKIQFLPIFNLFVIMRNLAKLMLSIFLALKMGSPLTAETRVEPPDEEHIFRDDSSTLEKARKIRSTTVRKNDAPATGDLDFKAPTVEFEKEKNTIKGKGGIIVSQSGTQAQAEEGEVNLTTKSGDLKGDVMISTSTAAISSDSSNFNFESETGQFLNADVDLLDGGYLLEAEKADKLSEFSYELFDTAFTTCRCSDSSKPWEISAGRSHITQESYAHCYNNVVSFHGVPVFYTPYLAFPVKQERQSGLLVPQYGYSSEDGIQFKQPIFAVLDETSDATISPFIETQTRAGSALDYRQVFSRKSRINGRLIYSNETLRDDDLRGTKINDVFDPSIDDDRFLGFLTQSWRSESDSTVPLAVLSDIHLASDDLAVRELDDDQIADRRSRYLTSQIVARATLSDYVSADLASEYNQFIDKDDDLGFQRLPEFNLRGLKSFHAFGSNPYGLKLISQAKATITEFDRKRGYDGTRFDINPSLGLPFHYKNYFASQAEVGVRQTSYSMSDQIDPANGTTLDSSNDRLLFNAGYAMSTGIEKVYDLEKDNWLTYLTSLGSENQAYKLRRLKHTIEPFWRYTYVPPTKQGDLPFYDSVDRVRERSLFLYGFRTSLYGRFLPTPGSERAITELTPRVEELPDLNSVAPLPDFGTLDDYVGLGGNVSTRTGAIRELTALTIKQSYDYSEDKNDRDKQQDALSDVNTELSFFPSNNFAFSFISNYGAEERHMSDWAIASHLMDDRGDSLKVRYSYQVESIDRGKTGISQLEGNLEIVLAEQLKIGGYTNFDDDESEFIENRVGLRVISSCNCWHMDIGLSDRTNPDKKQAFVSFTFAGLGDITQDFGFDKRRTP